MNYYFIYDYNNNPNCNNNRINKSKPITTTNRTTRKQQTKQTKDFSCLGAHCTVLAEQQSNKGNKRQIEMMEITTQQ